MYIYLGVTLIKQGLRHGDTFLEFPKHITDKDILDLIIPIEKLQEAQKEMKNPASLYSIKIQRLIKKRRD